MPFGSYLRKQRELRKWTIKEVADRLGFSSSYVSQLENGSRVPSRKQLEALAKGYEISLEDINNQWAATKIHKVSRESNYRFSIKDANESHVKIPVVSKIPVDELDPVLEATTEFYLLSKSDVPASHRVFGFRANGLSFSSAGILSGDLLIVDPDTEAKSGDVVVLATPDGLVMSYYHERGGHLELRPEVAGFKKTYLREECKVVGCLVYHIKKY